MVAGSSRYGKARIAEALTEDRSVDFQAFTALAEVEAWVRGPA